MVFIILYYFPLKVPQTCSGTATYYLFPLLLLPRAEYVQSTGHGKFITHWRIMMHLLYHSDASSLHQSFLVYKVLSIVLSCLILLPTLQSRFNRERHRRILGKDKWFSVLEQNLELFRQPWVHLACPSSHH